jgi:hypothetical protein
LPPATFKELKRVAALISSPQSEWEQVLGKTEDDPDFDPETYLPCDSWDLPGRYMTVDFRTIPGRGDLDAPVIINFRRLEDHSTPEHWYAKNNYWVPTLSDLDRIATIFGLHRIMGDNPTSKCIWSRADGALIAIRDRRDFAIYTWLYLAESSEFKQYLRQR